MVISYLSTPRQNNTPANWQEPSDYLLLEKVSNDLIAWQFLRRNLEYQRDYQYFITVWHELEVKYGAPPNRDFNAWKQDPRAYRCEREIYHLNENASEVCASPDDKLLIECWMGTKWGFYKFPLNPTKNNPIIGEDLSWRTDPENVKLLDGNTIAALSKSNSHFENKAAIVFDLNKDLKQQIQSAKQQLIIAQRQIAQLNHNNKNWILSLRLLDALQSKISDNDIQRSLGLEHVNYESLKRQANDLLNGGYREIISHLY